MVKITTFQFTEYPTVYFKLFYFLHFIFTINNAFHGQRSSTKGICQ